MVFPAFAKHVFDAAHVSVQLALDLPCPDDRTGDRRKVSVATHVTRLALRILDLELFVKRLDVILDSLDQLSLVLADGASDVRANKERIEAREYSKHLVGVLCRPQLITKTSRDAGLHTVDSLVVSSQ